MTSRPQPQMPSDKRSARPPSPQGFAWHDQAALTDLAAPYGFTVDVEEYELAFLDVSPAAYLDREARDHPMAVAGLALLDRRGQGRAVRRRLLQILERGNEDVSRFRMTSKYVVGTLRRGSQHS
jgi:hypothetical protein